MWALNRIEFPALVPLSVSNVSRKSGVWRHGIVHPLSKKPRTLLFLPKIADCFSGSRLEVSAWFCFLLHTGLVGLAISYALSVRDRLSGMVTSFTETEKQMVSVERAVQYIEDIPSEVSPHGTVRDSILEKDRPFWRFFTQGSHRPWKSTKSLISPWKWKIVDIQKKFCNGYFWIYKVFPLQNIYFRRHVGELLQYGEGL